MNIPVLRWLSVFLAASLILAACAGLNRQSPAQPSPTPIGVRGAELEGVGGLPYPDPLVLDGDVIVAGSSTVFPLAEVMAYRFLDEGFRGYITIDSIGSGAGFERFCVSGETDVAMASRAIKDGEVESCRKIGREPIEFRVGTDALAIVVSQQNDFLENVSLEELARIYSSDVTRWSDVNPAWPAQDIKRYSPGTDSGTYDFFIEEVMDPAYGEEAQARLLQAEGINLSEDDNVLVQGVVGSPYAIGYIGFAFYQENANQLRAVPIDDTSPTAETAESGEYALSRPLYLYSDGGIMQSKPQVAGFINFFLSYVNEEILDVGYFPASQESLTQARQNWLEAMQMDEEG